MNEPQLRRNHSVSELTSPRLSRLNRQTVPVPWASTQKIQAFTI